MTTKEIIMQLEQMAVPSIKKTLLKHGAAEPLLGVKIGDMKPLQKQLKKNYPISMELYASGVYEARYLAGLIADESRMTIDDIRRWAHEADGPMLREYTIPWVASESVYGHQLALEWIESENEGLASSGWCTVSCLLALKPDAELDFDELKTMMKRVETSIQQAGNRVKYTMNGFVLAVGAYVAPLTELAIETARRIGPVYVDMDGTACKVPEVISYLDKMKKGGHIGKKKKTVKC